MFLIQFPPNHKQFDQTVGFFKEYSLAYQSEVLPDLVEPRITNRDKTYIGVKAIEQLMTELKDYYGQNYNCSCAR